MDSEEVQHREGILLQQNKVLFRDVATRAQEVLDLLIEYFGREAVYDSLHVCLGGTSDCFKHLHVLFLVAVDEVLFEGLLHLRLVHGLVSLPVLRLFEGDLSFGCSSLYLH